MTSLVGSMREKSMPVCTSSTGRRGAHESGWIGPSLEALVSILVILWHNTMLSAAYHVGSAAGALRPLLNAGTDIDSTESTPMREKDDGELERSDALPLL